MSSSDFYLTPGTLSNMYTQALEKAGYGRVRGWRSLRMDVEVLTEEGKVVSLTVGKGNQVELREVSSPS